MNELFHFIIEIFIFQCKNSFFFKCHCKQNKREKNMEGIVEKEKAIPIKAVYFIFFRHL